MIPVAGLINSITKQIAVTFSNYMVSTHPTKTLRMIFRLRYLMRIMMDENYSKICYFQKFSFFQSVGKPISFSWAKGHSPIIVNNLLLKQSS